MWEKLLVDTRDHLAESASSDVHERREHFLERYWTRGIFGSVGLVARNFVNLRQERCPGSHWERRLPRRHDEFRRSEFVQPIPLKPAVECMRGAGAENAAPAGKGLSFPSVVPVLARPRTRQPLLQSQSNATGEVQGIGHENRLRGIQENSPKANARLSTASCQLQPSCQHNVDVNTKGNPRV